MAITDEWRIAYARQARADLLAREHLLASDRLPQCQQLHFLQMACEKICKAFLCGKGSAPADLRRSHGYIARPLPVIARHYSRRRRNGEAAWVLEAIADLARRIERLAPAMNEGGAYPANCEYPWEGPDGNVETPAEFDFGIDLARQRGGRHLLKLLQTAAEDLSTHNETR